MEKICVAVRVRPPVTTNHQEQQSPINGTFFWNVDDNRISLHKSSGSPLSAISFSFDHVFDETCPNSRVYELLTKDIINAAIEGFNGTVFAYGQTSSGKTFTMNGSENDPGIIHRAIKDVFDMIQQHDEREFLIRVSYMEIYNEEINDLLVVHHQKLPIHESVERGVFVAGLREEIVSTAEQVHKLLEAGEVNRHFGETNMNVRSSRSHTIFRMVIESKNTAMDGSSSDAIRVSVLNLVDLAGSERIAKTGADGVRLKEGKHINTSLMVLGNVINKLSDGAKQRGHIPYRDSKLTRILQSALGGNAKTSIICTVAPEEVHAEETKGTLQFANRAKRVTNCAQVNEILSDAALLKRQTLEIEELRKKLEGSQAELLEQEILKLRNDLLKFELEREKLALELEEERKLQRQRDLHIKEQQIKIDSLSSMVHFSDSDEKSHTQNQSSIRQPSVGSNHQIQRSEEVLATPCIKPVPGSFVARRSNYTAVWDCESSPMPDSFNNIADEDEWTKLNKGFVADLDSLLMTPAVKVRSLSSDGITPGVSKNTYEHEIQNLKKQMEVAIRERDEREVFSKKSYEQEIQNLKKQMELAIKERDDLEVFSKKNHEQEIQNFKKQMELAIKERDELEKKHRDQVLLNEQFTKDIVQLQEEAKVAREISHMIHESVTTCKHIYEDVLSVMQHSVNDEKSFAKNFLSSMNEIGCNLFSTLEIHCTEAIDGDRTFSRDNTLLQDQCKLLCERLSSKVVLSSSSEVDSTTKNGLKGSQHTSNYKGPLFVGDYASWKETLSNELDKIKEIYFCLEKDLNPNNQILEDTKAKCGDLERQVLLLMEDRESLLDNVAKSAQNFTLLSEQKEMVLEKYNAEVQKRKDLEEGIKQFSIAYASRQKSLVSFHSDLKSGIQGLRSHK